MRSYGGFVEKVAAGDLTTSVERAAAATSPPRREPRSDERRPALWMTLRVQEAVALLGSAAAEIMTTATEQRERDRDGPQR